MTKAKRVRPQRLMLSPYCRGVASGGAGGATAPPRNLADQLTLFEPGGADFATHTTASPPGFKKLSTPLYCDDQ